MAGTLSPTMQDAVNAAKEHSNRLRRFPGGFWAWAGYSDTWFSTPTIQALVSRGVMEYTDWHTRSSGTRFPIEASLTQVEEGLDAILNDPKRAAELYDEIWPIIDRNK